MVTTKGDVYSYGVVLMEIMTGKKPTNNEFNDEMSLRDYVKLSLNGDVTKFLDGGLVDKSDRGFEECVLSVLSLALNCTEESPVRRIAMNDVVLRLAKIRSEAMKGNVVQIRLKGHEEEVGLIWG